MTPASEAVLARLHERAEQERQVQAAISRAEMEARIDDFMLPIGPEAGLFLNMLIKAAGARAILEIGTSVGYSTLWLADAARTVGGHVTTLDANPAKHAQARTNLEEAGLAGHVTLVAGDALAAIAEQAGPFDFVLLDVGRELYVPCLEAVRPRLRPGALIAADNMTHPPATRTLAEAYQQRVRGEPGADSVLVPIGNGVELTRLAG